MITIKPYGGLGNRLRSLDSAVALAECTGKDLKVIWDRNEEFNCAFSRLFEETPVFDIKEISSSYFPRKIKEKLLLLAHKLKVKYPNQYDCILLESDIMKMKEENYNFCNLNTCNNLFININGRFLFPEKPYQYLKPVDFISKKVDSIVENFSPYTVGVHIRRTDKDRKSVV